MADFNGLGMNPGNLSRLSPALSRSISPENFTGEPGKGGMAVEGTGKIAADDPIKKLTLADVKPYIKRQKSYEMTVKTNAFATMVAHGIHGLDAIQSINYFDDPSQVWERSRETIEQYQQKTFGEEPQTGDNQFEVDTELSSDRITDQIDRSPNING